MGKVKIELEEPKPITIKYRDFEIEVIPFLSVDKQLFLIEKYLEDYFNGSENLVEGSAYSISNAEFNLLNFIIQLNTNIDFENLDRNIYVDNEFLNIIETEIPNYYGFREMLDWHISDKKEKIALENSVGKVLSDLSGKGLEILNSFSETSPEEIQKLQETGIKLIEELKNSSIIEDSNREVKP